MLSFYHIKKKKTIYIIRCSVTVFRPAVFLAQIGGFNKSFSFMFNKVLAKTF